MGLAFLPWQQATLPALLIPYYTSCVPELKIVSKNLQDTDFEADSGSLWNVQESYETYDCLKNRHVQNDKIKKCANLGFAYGAGFVFVQLR
ncbi:hypothetical protein TH5_06900 [Thalassospira xianhensis MCCC 1A02616]|uniref:Uncharacterized protein n=1 Tax=Thalassospira xianhensis MCCC 1A02616 TaxID=1177929 RepID=A0A367UEX5_9PROT|nr:hypothetical protein TH5_06900 [Thalassospira xianhensis MCCC 1A02616]